MPKSKTNALTIPSRVKDITPELDDVRTIALENHKNPTPYDIGLIEGMASHLIPATEICAIIRMSKSRFEKSLAFQAAFERGNLMGKASLRRMMYVGAKTQPVLQIWLSKQHLGMTDKPEPVQGESQQDAYKGFLDKLNIVINIPAAGQPAPIVIGSGTTDRTARVEDVGTRSPTTAKPITVVGTAKNEGMDSGVESAGEESRKSFHRLVEDMVISSRSR